jgi:hypothetical protein
MSIPEFVSKLLLTEPGAPFSVQLEIDTDGDVQALFEVLLMTMTEVLKRWYSPPISIGVISPENLARLIGYFASFGTKFIMDVDENPRVISINNKEYLHKSRLDQMKFQMSHEGRLYTVRFSNLPAA